MQIDFAISRILRYQNRMQDLEFILTYVKEPSKGHLRMLQLALTIKWSQCFLTSVMGPSLTG